MNFKNIQCVTSIGLGLFLSVSVTPAKALETENKTTSSENSKMLLSQLEGHDIWGGGKQMGWEDLTIGRVIGKSGDILFIRTMEGEFFNAGGTFCPGSDVLVHKDANGRLHLVDKAHSQWISRLMADYGWKKVAVSGNLNERTAAIWADMEKSSATVREVPARTEVITAPATTTYTAEPEMQPVQQPIRGLW